MPEADDKTIRNYVADKVANALGPFNISKLYKDYEILKDIGKLKRDIGILHKGSTVFVDSRGSQVFEYETAYSVVVIIQRGIDNVSFNAERNEERLDKLVTNIGNALLTDNQASTCPFSQPAHILEYGIANQENPPIVLPGGDEKDWTGLLVLYCTINIFHRRIF
jgi:hypothetical protein